MTFVNRSLIIILIFLLVFSNVLWAYMYYINMQHKDNALRECSNALAIILAHAGALLREASEKGQSEYVEVVYMLVDHALLIAQTLDQLTGSSDWAHKVVGATASLHDLLASAHQGYTISKDKLVKIAEALEKLAKALRNLDIESIEQYSQKLETLAYST